MERLGNSVYLGSYPQGKEGEVMPVCWRIIGEGDGYLVLMSEKILDSAMFNEEPSGSEERWYDYQHSKGGYDDVYGNDYLTSSIRRRVKEMAEKCFTEEEKAMLIPDENGDIATLLTASAVAGLPLELRKKNSTDYARTLGFRYNGADEYEAWWLKSAEIPPRDSKYADAVYAQDGKPPYYFGVAGKLYGCYVIIRNGIVLAVRVRVNA